ncbi:MAG: choice-of-anchor D domain-containing protein [Acidobacteria bacterium]|nr:choice-of-anchor D domain-containing protein [Acidobacteriota bacterium]
MSGCVGLAGDKAPSAAPQLVVTPSAVTFQNVVVGQKNTQTIHLSNTGTADLDISAVSLTGSGFSLGSIAAPLKLAPNASKNFTVSFAATSVTTSAKATIAIASNDTTSPLTVPVSGSTVKANPAWQLVPAVVSFPSTTVHGTKSQTVTLSNTGNVPMTVNAIAFTSPVFTLSGMNPGTTVNEGQQFTFQVNFHPAAAGNSSGSLKLTSSIGTTLSMSLSGAATTASTPSSVPHTVTLTWNPSSGGNIVGYRVYRGTTSGGPYFGLNSSVDSSISYTDSSVVAGGKYFYVATSVDASGNESAFSNEASATVPNP